ncbi:hypothetical protein MMYC01_208835 [Madurella mycetomatis]|uniref:Fucose-specific lectin n=1 Tax=Madurella mycetomatis TaxID=100816 RepID=A0A175VPQ9_9PEZI|nr:hypothetical protein MMYC01_210044 [Madurella mycetomatis]KXX74217.1 hypothetical protein MMYC01_208835 [Madurella mycetomatis]
MSSAVKQLVKRLASLASSPAEDEDEDEYYILRQSGPNLCQIPVTVGGKEGIKKAVARDVKQGTPALYLRMVFYLDKSNHLRCNSPDENGHWEETEMFGLPGPMAVHPDSQLSGSVSRDRVWVIYQTPKEEMVAVMKQSSRWSVAGVIPAEIPRGASHVPLGDANNPDALHLFFPTKTGDICHTYGDFISGKWTSKTVESSQFPGGVSRFIVVPTEIPESFDLYVATGDSRLVLVSSSGDQVEIGKINGDQFIAQNRAEASWGLNLSFGSWGKLVLGFFRPEPLGYEA